MTLRFQQRIQIFPIVVLLAAAVSGLAQTANPKDALARTMTDGSLANVYNVRNYGASGTGHTKDTEAINKAIDVCARGGGGTVYVPPGSYLTGQMVLKSNITLHVEAGATLLASNDPEDYPILPSPYHEVVGSPWPNVTTFYSALIYGNGASNISISGRGKIDGQGRWWWDKVTLLLRSRQHATLTSVQLREIEVLNHMRPPLINLVNCQRVRIDGLTLQNAPATNVETTLCDNVVIHDVTILNPPNAYNTDGIVPCSSRYVHISNCLIDVGDDCIAIKSGRDRWGREMNRPSEDITITNCVMLHGHAGVAIGSEMSGGVRNVVVSNCVFHGTENGLRMKTVRGRGGVVDGFAASNITMDNVPQPIQIYMCYGNPLADMKKEPVNEGTPTFKNIMFSNILAAGARSAGNIFGLPEMPPAEIVLNNIHISADKGLQVRWVRGLSLHNVKIDTIQGPAVRLGEADRVEIEGFSTATPHSGTSVLDLEDVRNAYLRQNWASPDSDVFLKLSGKSTRDIVLLDNNLTGAKRPVEISPEVVDTKIVQK